MSRIGSSSAIGSVRAERVSEDTVVVWVSGEQDLSNVAVLASSLAAAVSTDAGAVVVDVGDVSFLAATSVGAVVAAGVELRHRGRQLIIRAPSPFVRRVLVMCGLGGLISVLAPIGCTGRDEPDPNQALVRV
jgi:anti-anti-sigma factor